MDEPISSTPIAEIDAAMLWAAFRISGANGYITLRPARARGYVLLEALSDCKALVLSFEVENGCDDLPRPVGLHPADVADLKRKNYNAKTVRLEIVNGTDPGLLALRPLGGEGCHGFVCEEAQPLPPLPLAGLPSPWWEPGPAVPAPILLNVERMRRMLHAISDSKLSRNVELIVTADNAAVGIAVRPWSDEAPAGSVQLCRSVLAAETGLA